MTIDLIKPILTKIGRYVSPRCIHNLNSVTNYLEVGRWVRARRYSPEVWLRTREDFWELLEKAFGDSVVLYLEFGVAHGNTLRPMTKHLRNPHSMLHGFDSFEGLPECWNHWDVGGFSLNGALPRIDDPRVTLHKGWFHETLPEFVLPPHNVLFINCDADLYSSTAYVLTHLRDHIVPGTYLYFDEFCNRNHELRAFDEFLDSTKYSFDLVAANPIFEYVLFRRIDR